jgi:hypothetical protein
MSLPWFRFYAEFAGDPIVQSLAFEDQRHFVVLLCMKCDGTLDRPIDNKVRERIICRGLGLDPVTASEAKRRLVEVGLIDKDWQPSGWNKRQYVSDKSTDRVRKHRKNKETGNVSETLPERSCNGPDTDTDTEEKTRTRATKPRTQKQPLAPPPEVDAEAWSRFEQHRRELRKGLTEEGRKRNFALLARYPADVQAEMIDVSIRNGWSGLFELKDAKQAKQQPPAPEPPKRKPMADLMRGAQ